VLASNRHRLAHRNARRTALRPIRRSSPSDQNLRVGRAIVAAGVPQAVRGGLPAIKAIDPVGTHVDIRLAHAHQIGNQPAHPRPHRHTDVLRSERE